MSELFEQAYEAVCQELELGQEPTAEEVEAKLVDLMSDAMDRAVDQLKHRGL